MSKKSKDKKKRAEKAAPSGKRAEKPVSKGGVRSPWGEVLSFLVSWRLVPVLILVGLFFRLSVTLWQPIMYPDSMQYMHLAREIRDGSFFQKDYSLDQGFIKSRRLPPLYSFLISPFAGTQADLEKVGIIISLLMSLAAFIPLYLAGALVFGRRTALVVCALFTFQAFTLRYSNPILSEATFTALYAGVIAMSVYAMARRSIMLFVLTGVMCALAYLTRDVGITAAPLAATAAVIKLRLLDRLSWKRVASMVLALLISTLAVMAPYLVHIRARTGHWGLTVQMNNTSITRQLQMFGGDKYDRDRLPGSARGTDLVGGKPARGVLDLVKLAPQLTLKLIKNMKLYGKELFAKWTEFLLALILAGAAGIFLLHGRDRERLFYGCYVLVWILQLWALYSLITPYMVDVRYMYPLMAVGVLVGGQGIGTIADWVRDLLSRPATDRGDDRSGSGWYLGLMGLATAVIYVLVLRQFVDRDALRSFSTMYDGRGMVAYLYPLIGAAVVFFLAMVPLAEKTRNLLKLEPGFPRKLVGLIAGLAGSGAFLLWLPGLDGPMVTYLPGMALVGAAAALTLVMAVAAWPRLARSLSPVLAMFLVAAAFAAQGHEYLTLRHRTSKNTLDNKYASGHKQVAQEMLKLGLASRGKVVCSRKTFIAYYLDCNWWPLPMTRPEVESLIASGEIDYLVADSFTLKSLRPALVSLALDIKPLPGASPIYSRYFPEYDRIITVYDCHRPETPVPERTEAGHLDRVKDYIHAGNLVFAQNELNTMVKSHPDNLMAWKGIRSILETYYRVSVRGDIPSIAFTPELLPALIEVARKCYRLDPADEEAAEHYHGVEWLYQKELQEIEQMKTRKRR